MLKHVLILCLWWLLDECMINSYNTKYVICAVYICQACYIIMLWCSMHEKRGIEHAKINGKGPTPLLKAQLEVMRKQGKPSSNDLKFFRKILRIPSFKMSQSLLNLDVYAESYDLPKLREKSGKLKNDQMNSECSRIKLYWLSNELAECVFFPYRELDKLYLETWTTWFRVF